MSRTRTSLRTRSERIDLVHNVVAGLVRNFSDPSMRGPLWTVETMLRLIDGQIRTQALLHSIPERHHAEMVMDGLTFYDRHLAPVMARVTGVEMIGGIVMTEGARIPGETIEENTKRIKLEIARRMRRFADRVERDPNVMIAYDHANPHSNKRPNVETLSVTLAREPA